MLCWTAFELRVITRWSKRIRMYELGYCLLLLLLCERKLTIFPKGNIRYKHDLFSKSRQVSNSFVPAEYSNGYIQTILFCLFEFIQLTNKLVFRWRREKKNNRQHREIYIFVKILKDPYRVGIPGSRGVFSKTLISNSLIEF